MAPFGSVIPVTGLNLGYRGQIARTGGGDPVIVAKFANASNVNNISFGDPVMLLPDSVGGTYRQVADFLANGGGLLISSTTATSTTVTVATAGLVPGMFVIGAGIPVGTTIVSITATTITISQAATASATVNLSYALLGGLAVREVKTQLTYPITPGSSVIGTYLPGQMTEAMVSGTIIGQIYVGTPVAGGAIWLRVIANGGIPAGVVGQLEAAPDGVNNVRIPGWLFKTGVLDANNFAEINILNRIAV